MDWFGWRHQKDATAGNAAAFGPEAILADLEERVPKYLEAVDQGKLVYPACKRKPDDAEADVRSIWDHTRLEAVRYVMMVPARGFDLLGVPARQPEILDAYLRQLPHEDTVIDFTGSAMNDLSMAIVAGFNWLNHCAGLVDVDRSKFLGTLSSFRKRAVVARQWWATEGAEARCSQMLAEHENPPLMLYLMSAEYTRLAKEIASAAVFGSAVDRARVPDELTQAMASFESARDPGDLT